jgi:hypothetical protein
VNILNPKFKILNIIFAFCIILLISGCSRTVTQIVKFGDQIVVEVTLRGNLDNNSNRYFLVVSSVESYRVPLPPPDIVEEAPEFIEPDMTPQTGSIEAYFTNFFSSWAGYVVLDPSGYNLVKGPFEIGQVLTRESISSLVNISNKISFNFELDRLFDVVPDNIYFDFITVSWPDGEQKIPEDHLPSTGNVISKDAGSITIVSDGEDPELDPSLDILNCTVEIQ